MEKNKQGQAIWSICCGLNCEKWALHTGLEADLKVCIFSKFPKSNKLENVMKTKVIYRLTIDLKFTGSAEITYFASIKAWVTDAGFQDL